MTKVPFEETKVVHVEKWLVGAGLAAIIALLTWNVTVTQQLTVDVAVIKSTLDRDAMAPDPALLQDKIVRLEKWNDNLSKRLADVENYIRNVKAN